MLEGNLLIYKNFNLSPQLKISTKILSITHQILVKKSNLVHSAFIANKSSWNLMVKSTENIKFFIDTISSLIHNISCETQSPKWLEQNGLKLWLKKCLLCKCEALSSNPSLTKKVKHTASPL
jgi:hypothetical protein